MRWMGLMKNQIFTLNTWLWTSNSPFMLPSQLLTPNYFLALLDHYYALSFSPLKCPKFPLKFILWVSWFFLSFLKKWKSRKIFPSSYIYPICQYLYSYTLTFLPLPQMDYLLSSNASPTTNTATFALNPIHVHLLEEVALAILPSLLHSYFPFSTI